MIACVFGVAANFYPKLEMIREPRGPFGRMIDKVYRDVSLFENDKLCLMKCPRGKKTACGFRILNSGII